MYLIWYGKDLVKQEIHSAYLEHGILHNHHTVPFLEPEFRIANVSHRRTVGLRPST